MLNKFLNVVLLEKPLKKMFWFECRLPLKDFKNIDILTSVPCAYKIYVTIILNIIMFIVIYKKILLNLCFQAEIQNPGHFFTPGPIITPNRSIRQPDITPPTPGEFYQSTELPDAG